ELVRSTIGVLAILAILALTVVNTCQLDAIERKLVTNPPGGTSGAREPVAPTSCQVVPATPLKETDPLAQAAGNRLVPAVRAWANAPHVECGTLRFEFGADPPGL